MNAAIARRRWRSPNGITQLRHSSLIERTKRSRQSPGKSRRDACSAGSVPGERGPAPAERAGVQPRESLAAAGAADADRHLVADQSPAAPRQDGWAAGQTREVLLAPAGREPPDPTSVRKHAAADRRAALADRIGRCGGEANRSKEGGDG